MASYVERMARWRVPLHFALAAAVAVFARPTGLLLGTGASLVAVGLVVRAWAAGHLRRDASLTTSGPYAHLRHPLYLGSAFVLAGFGVAGGRVWLAVLFGLYFLLLFVPVMQREERERRARSPDLYADYAKQVPALLPRPLPARVRGESRVRFDAVLYLRNREWRAALGCALLLGILYGRMVWG